jgi:hypothetical protein
VSRKAEDNQVAAFHNLIHRQLVIFCSLPRLVGAHLSELLLQCHLGGDALILEMVSFQDSDCTEF